MIDTWWYMSSEQVGDRLIGPAHVNKITTTSRSKVPLTVGDLDPGSPLVPWTHMSQPQAASREMQPFWLISTQALVKDVV